MTTAATRLSSIQCEGSRGELLKIVSKQTIRLPEGTAEAPNKDELASSVLPPASSILPIRVQVRIDRKLVPLQDLQVSGLLKAILTFLTEYSTRLRFKAVLEADIDENALEVPLLLEPFPSPLTLRFDDPPSRLASLAFALHFYSPGNTTASSTSTWDILLSTSLTPSLSSLLFRAMLKCMLGLAARYPLVFDARWLEHLQDQSVYLPSLGKSLRRLSRKASQEAHSSLIQRCIARLINGSCSQSNSDPDSRSKVVDSGTKSPLPSAAQPSVDGLSEVLQSAFFRLSLRASRSKHALVKVVLPTSDTLSEGILHDLVTHQARESGLHTLQDHPNLHDSGLMPDSTDEPSSLWSDVQAILQQEDCSELEPCEPSKFLLADQDFDPQPVQRRYSEVEHSSGYVHMPDDMLSLLLPSWVPCESGSTGLTSPANVDEEMESTNIDPLPHSYHRTDFSSSQPPSIMTVPLSSAVTYTDQVNAVRHQCLFRASDTTFHYERMLLDNTGSDSMASTTVDMDVDDSYLDEVDAKLAELTEHSELDSVDQRLIALLQG